MSISIIVPCYNEEEALPIYYKKYKTLFSLIPKENFELILINDGSIDNTLSIMKKLALEDSSVKYISFSRNFGKEAGIYAGLEQSTGDYVAIMDVDLQDPIELLPEMYEIVSGSEYECAATRRVDRKGEPPIRSWFARKFYKLMNRYSKTELVDGARDYRLMSRKYVNAILSMKEYNRFSKGIFGWVGFKTKWLEYENIQRSAGETKWNFWSLFAYAIEGITAFTTAPLVISVIIGILLSIIAICAVVFIFIRKLVFGDPVSGWASTVCIMLFLGGVQLMFIGVIGQYLAKTYLEVKNRPIYIIDESNIDENYTSFEFPADPAFFE